MNARIGKILSRLFVLIFVFNLFVPAAAAARACTDHPCCCLGSVAMTHHGPAPEVYSAANGCCSDASRIPCNLTDDFGRRSSIFAVSSTRPPVSCEPVRLVSTGVEQPSCETFAEFSVKSEFRIPSDPVPLYLQNLSLIC